MTVTAWILAVIFTIVNGAIFLSSRHYWKRVEVEQKEFAQQYIVAAEKDRVTIYDLRFQVRRLTNKLNDQEWATSKHHRDAVANLGRAFEAEAKTLTYEEHIMEDRAHMHCPIRAEIVKAREAVND